MDVADVVAKPLQQPLVGAVGADDADAAGENRADVEVAVRGRLKAVGIASGSSSTQTSSTLPLST
jgi:hypothetical protein